MPDLARHRPTSRLPAILAAGIALLTSVYAVVVNLATDSVPETLAWAHNPWLLWSTVVLLAVAAAVLAAWSQRPLDRRRSARAVRVGRPIETLTDRVALDLEVHRAIDAGADAAGLGPLPAYILRDHDHALRAAVARAAAGESQLVVLVGGSSTGKTRACWEAITTSRALLAGWQLWHPIDPGRPEAAAEALEEGVGPKTVVWLNETQHYLLTPNTTLGERVAAGLRELLRTPARGPVLVLGTIWPEYWATLTTTPSPGSPDPHAHARALLAGTAIEVPDTFTSRDLAALGEQAATDLRLVEARDHAEEGQITQYLAGGPALLEHYTTAPPAAKAIITAAMDARRLGHSLPLPHSLLTHAAVGYLTSQQADDLDNDGRWFAAALTYASQPSRGARGPLTPIRSHSTDLLLRAVEGQDGLRYRLADYLEQHARTIRRFTAPPAAFWEAACHAATNDDVCALGDAARSRGRYRYAAALYQHAADAGDRNALLRLARLRGELGDRAGAEALYQQAANAGDATALLALFRSREHARDLAGAEALYQQAVNAGDAEVLTELAKLRERAGDQAGAEALAHQLAEADHPEALTELAAMREEELFDWDGAVALYQQAANAGDPEALIHLAMVREGAGDRASAEALAHQAVEAGYPWALSRVAWVREEDGDRAGAQALYERAADAGDSLAVLDVARLREKAGDLAGAEAIYQQAADAGHNFALTGLAELRERAGDQAGAEALAHQATDAGEYMAVYMLAIERGRVGDDAGAAALYQQAADAGDPAALASLARLRERAGDQAGAEALYQRVADAGFLDALNDLARLREEAGDRAGAAAFYERAADAGDPGAVNKLARVREEAGDRASAEAIRRFGLDANGEPAAPW